MLVLTRKPGESLVIGHEITVTVLKVEGDRVRLGIQAPPTVRILRHELQIQMPCPGGGSGLTRACP
jgi:carbon storage regulator